MKKRTRKRRTLSLHDEQRATQKALDLNGAGKLQLRGHQRAFFRELMALCAAHQVVLRRARLAMLHADPEKIAHYHCAGNGRYMDVSRLPSHELAWPNVVLVAGSSRSLRKRKAL